MSEIRIIHQQIQLSLEQSLTQSRVTDKFVANLTLGQNLNAQIVKLDNKYYLMIENIKLPVAKETIEQMGLKENQLIRMKVKSVSDPVELQIIKKKSVLSDQIKPSTITGSNIKHVPGNVNQQTISGNQSTGTSDSTKDNSPLEKPAGTNKINVDKLIHEARKYLSKDLLSPSINANKTAITESSKHIANKPVSAQSVSTGNESAKSTPTPSGSGKRNEIQTKSENPGNMKTSQRLRSLISQSKTGTIDNTNKTEHSPVTPTKQEKGATAFKPSALHSEQAVLKADKTIIQQHGSTKSDKPVFNTTVEVTKKPASPSANAGNLTAKVTKATTAVSGQIINKTVTIPSEQVTNKTATTPSGQVNAKTVTTPSGQVTTKIATTSSEQITTKAAESKSTITSDLTTNNRQEATPAKKIKLEVPVTMPDSHKFPLLSEKMDTAFQRLLPAQNTSGKSINNLFLQLQRLNQWTSDLKSSGRTTHASHPEKLASDLKESLRDLFRYINHKDNLKTGKSIEKALRQSGTFLEKRVNAQQLAAKQGGQKLSNELTLHKDVKANLNRVLATTLYNLAKITASTSTSSSSATSSSTGTTSTSTGSGTTASTRSSAESSQAGLSRQLTGNSGTGNNNLIQSIRSRLQKYVGTKANPNILPELERITREVLKNVQSALFRSQLGQLTNLRPESAPQQWLFELPVMNDKEVDTFLIQFAEQEANEEENDSKKGWSLILQFDIAPLGKLRAMLIWQKEQIKVRFLAEQQNTAELVTNELDYFQKVLNKQGLSFEELTVEQALLDDIEINFSRGNSNG